jgi:hypothetical protein
VESHFGEQFRFNHQALHIRKGIRSHGTHADYFVRDGFYLDQVGVIRRSAGGGNDDTVFHQLISLLTKCGRKRKAQQEYDKDFQFTPILTSALIEIA